MFRSKYKKLKNEKADQSYNNYKDKQIEYCKSEFLDRSFLSNLCCTTSDDIKTSTTIKYRKAPQHKLRYKIIKKMLKNLNENEIKSVETKNSNLKIPNLLKKLTKNLFNTVDDKSPLVLNNVKNNSNQRTLDSHPSKFVKIKNDLECPEWLQCRIPRETLLENLYHQSPGSFFVRKSKKKRGCYTLSVRAPTPEPIILNYLILKTSRGYQIQGFSKEFSTLTGCITHHSVMKEQLPVPLSLARPYEMKLKLDKFTDDYCSPAEFCN